MIKNRPGPDSPANWAYAFVVAMCLNVVLFALGAGVYFLVSR